MNIEMKEKTMIRITTTLALLAIAIAVPVAKAEPPDAFERAVIAHRDALNADAVPIERHPPDVQDAAFAAQLQNRSDHLSYGPIDPGIAAAIRMHRSSAAPGPTATGVNSDRFDWSDFGIGAGAMLALVLSLGSLRKGALTVRARRSQAMNA
jgi:hypothetical protein